MRLWDVAWWWFLHASGSDNSAGPEYGFWSGFGSVWVQPPLLIAGALLYWHHTCHIGRCLRLSKHEYEMDGVTQKLCRKHHPKVNGKLTAQQVIDHHARNQ